LASLNLQICVEIPNLLLCSGRAHAARRRRRRDRHPKDVLPEVDIPVVVVVRTYTGLDTTETSQYITTYSEFSLPNNVNNIMESTTLQGVAIEKLYLKGGLDVRFSL
jgi:hypothetical protein